MINNVDRHVKNNIYFTLKLPRLDNACYVFRYTPTLYLQVMVIYFPNLDISYFEKTSLAKCQLLFWTSYIAKRASRSVLESEVLGFADALDTAYIMKHDVKLMTAPYIPLSMITGSLSLFDILTKDSFTTKKRLGTDLKTLQNPYNKMEIQDFAYVRSEHYIADALTKVTKPSLLINAIENLMLDHRIQQYNVGSNKRD